MAQISIGNWTKLGSTVRDVRARRGWSQHELARRAAVSRSWLARVEAGHRGAEFEQILRLLAALDLTLAVIDEVPSADEAHEPIRTSGDRAAMRQATQTLIAAHEAANASRRASWQLVTAEPTGG